MRRYHIQLDDGEAGAYVLLPGDPGRCEAIAARLDGARHLRSNREFTTFAGTLEGVPVSVISTGIGGPSTAICVEELVSIGVRTMIRVGTCGAMQDGIRSGEVVIVQGAMRDDGTSYHYVPAAFPAIADLEVVNALRDAARIAAQPHRVGVVFSTDSFYGQRDMDRMPVAAELRQRWEAAVRSGCLAAEMECAALLSVATTLGVRSGAALAVIDRSGPDAEPMPDPGHLPLDAVIEVAVGALRRLIATKRSY
jgi:uridine phosphorylase